MTRNIWWSLLATETASSFFEVLPSLAIHTQKLRSVISSALSCVFCLVVWWWGASKQQAKAIYCRESSSPILGAPAALNAAPIECIPLESSVPYLILSYAATFVNMSFYTNLVKNFCHQPGAPRFIHRCDGGRPLPILFYRLSHIGLYIFHYMIVNIRCSNTNRNIDHKSCINISSYISLYIILILIRGMASMSIEYLTFLYT